MKLRVLGCHGGELPKHRTTCFLVDGVLALDAGALTGVLPLEELVRIERVVVSHSHFDHVKDLPLLADLLVGRRDRPLVVHASVACARTLKRNVFNGEMWPDFTRIPSRARPVLRIEPFRPGVPFVAGRYRVTPIPVSHPVESCGFLLSDGKVSLGMSGDTGPTDGLWRVFNRAKNLHLLIVEASFPNELQGLADISGHLTPQALKGELAKLHVNGCPVVLYHVKPAHEAEVRREIRELKIGARILKIGDEFVL